MYVQEEQRDGLARRRDYGTPLNRFQLKTAQAFEDRELHASIGQRKGSLDAGGIVRIYLGLLHLRFPESNWAQGGEEHVLPDVHRRVDDGVSRWRYFLYGSVSILSTTAWTICKARNRCPGPTVSGPFPQYKTRKWRKDGMNLRLLYRPFIIWERLCACLGEVPSRI